MSWRVVEYIDQEIIMTWFMVDESGSHQALSFGINSRTWFLNKDIADPDTVEDMKGAIPEKDRALAMRRAIEARNER